MEHLDSAENMEKVTALAGELKIAGYWNLYQSRCPVRRLKKGILIFMLILPRWRI